LLNFAQRRLGILTDLGVLARFRPLRLAGGTYPYHYVLAHTGGLLVAGTRGERSPRPSETTVRLQRIASSHNLDHRLGINEFFVDLAAHERSHPGSMLHAWWPDTRLVGFSPLSTAELYSWIAVYLKSLSRRGPRPRNGVS